MLNIRMKSSSVSGGINRGDTLYLKGYWTQMLVEGVIGDDVFVVWLDHNAHLHRAKVHKDLLSGSR